MARVYKNCSCFPARLTEDYPCEEAIRRQTAAALGAIFPVVLTVVLPHSKISRANAKQKRRSAALHRLAVESCPQSRTAPHRRFASLDIIGVRGRMRASEN